MLSATRGKGARPNVSGINRDDAPIFQLTSLREMSRNQYHSIISFSSTCAILQVWLFSAIWHLVPRLLRLNTPHVLRQSSKWTGSSREVFHQAQETCKPDYGTARDMSIQNSLLTRTKIVSYSPSSPPLAPTLLTVPSTRTLALKYQWSTKWSALT